MNDTGFIAKGFHSEDGLALYYRDYPATSPACPVLCLPGLTRNSRDFAGLAAHLAATGRRVLCPDMRGRGHSQHDPDWRNYHPGTYVADTWGLLAREKLSRVIVIGTSLGGLMAMLMAAQRPERIAAVILNDIGPEVSPAGLARIAGYVGKLAAVSTWHEAALQCREVYGQALPDFTHDGWLAFARLGYREDPRGVPRLDMDPAIGTAMRESAASPRDLWDVFEALASTPALLLRGALSDILNERICNEMLRRKPDLRRVTIPRRGHPPMLDEPESLAAIDAFLADL